MNPQAVCNDVGMQGRTSIYADTIEAKGMRDSLYANAKVRCREPSSHSAVLQ